MQLWWEGRQYEWPPMCVEKNRPSFHQYFCTLWVHCPTRILQLMESKSSLIEHPHQTMKLSFEFSSHRSISLFKMPRCCWTLLLVWISIDSHYYMSNDLTIWAICIFFLPTMFGHIYETPSYSWVSCYFPVIIHGNCC